MGSFPSCTHAIKALLRLQKEPRSGLAAITHEEDVRSQTDAWRKGGCVLSCPILSCFPPTCLQRRPQHGTRALDGDIAIPDPPHPSQFIQVTR